MHKDAPTQSVTHGREGSEISFLPVPDTGGQVEREVSARLSCEQERCVCICMCVCVCTGECVRVGGLAGDCSTLTPLESHCPSLGLSFPICQMGEVFMILGSCLLQALSRCVLSRPGMVESRERWGEGPAPLGGPGH